LAIADHRESLIVTRTLEIVGELRIDRGGELIGGSDDFFGDGLEFCEMGDGVAVIEFAVGDEVDTRLEGTGEGLIRGGVEESFH
jgi:hypothetical protein